MRMNIEKYISQENFEKLVFAQGNQPVVFLSTGEQTNISELSLEGSDVTSALKSLEIKEFSFNDLPLGVFNTVFFRHGHAFSLKSYKFSDNIKFEISKVKSTQDRDLSTFFVPGYVKEWAHANKGILFFYGESKSLVDEIRLSFIKERGLNKSGSSLVFRESDPELISRSDHFYTFTDDNSFLDSVDTGLLDFTTYSLSKNFNQFSPVKILELSQTFSLITLSSVWRDFDKFWYSFKTWCGQETELRNLIMQETLGFVGVKTVDNKNGRRIPFFEVTPFDQSARTEISEKNLNTFRNSGLSYNQSLYNLLIRREVELAEAYRVSTDPEELGAMLDKSEVLNGY